jgi:Tol biopolymer transport system component
MKSIKYLIVLTSLVVWLLSCVTSPANTVKEVPKSLISITLISPTTISVTSIPTKSTGQIVYSENGYIYSINADGTNKTYLAKGRSPVWSPDGTQIAFLSSTGGDIVCGIFFMNSDGTNQRPLTFEHPEYQSPCDMIDWQNNGNLITYYAYSRTELNEVDTEIFSIDVNSDNPLQITHNKSSDDVDPSWSPDGKQIAFASPYFTEDTQALASAIHIMNADGSDEKQLTNQGFTDYSPVFSPNGKLIAFVSSRPNLISGLYVMNTNGSEQRLVIDEKMTNSRIIDPVWSPNGQWLLFTAWHDWSEEKPSQLFIVNIDGSNLTYLADGEDADWKP